jgi:YggT family protein
MDTLTAVKPLTPLQSALQVISAVIFIYTLLLALRIVLTWFRGTSFGKPWDYLCRITDPYLNIFRRIRFLRMGMFDFTPLAGILVLVILQGIVNQLSYRTISLSNVLGIILLAVWRSGVWILIFFIVLTAVRALGYFMARDQTSPLWKTMDIMLTPLTGAVSRMLRRDIEFIQALLIALAALLIAAIVGSLIVSKVTGLLFAAQSF